MRSNSRLALAGSLLALSSLLGGCTPSSQYRYTGMVPAARPIPFDGRTAEKGTARLEGSMTHEIVQEQQVPALHDSALHVPETTLEASGVYSIHDHVELGMRFSYAHYAWTGGTAVGAPPIPDRPSQIGAGPEMRFTFPLDREQRWAIGLAWNLMRYSLPSAEWERTASCAPGPRCYRDPLTSSPDVTYYSFRQTTAESVWLLNLSGLLSFAFGDRGDLGHVFGGFAFHPTFGNDGFTDTTSSGGKIEQKGWLPIATAGYAIRLHPARLGASLFLPIGGDERSVTYGFGGQLTVGVELGGPEKQAKSAPARALDAF